MFYARIENGVPVEYPLTEKQVRSRLNGVSLPIYITNESLTDFSYIRVESGSIDDFPEPNKDFTVVIDSIYFDTDFGIWKRNYKLVPVEESIKAQRLNQKWSEVRDKRDSLMKSFDWRVMRYNREVSLGITPKDNIDILNNYMQSLADITNTDDPFLVQFPEQP